MEIATLEEVNIILRPARVEDLLKSSIYEKKGHPTKMVLKYGQTFWLKRSDGTGFDNQPYLIGTSTVYKDLKTWFDQRRVYIAINNLYHKELQTAFAKAENPKAHV